jgi:hypothetical protein
MKLKKGIWANENEPTMVQADATWEKPRGSMPFPTTTGLSFDHRPKLGKPSVVRVEAGGLVGT